MRGKYAAVLWHVEGWAGASKACPFDVLNGQRLGGFRGLRGHIWVPKAMCGASRPCMKPLGHTWSPTVRSVEVLMREERTQMSVLKGTVSWAGSLLSKRRMVWRFRQGGLSQQ